MPRKNKLSRTKLDYQVAEIPLHLRDKYYTINTYRRAKASLRRCFKDRCGYSMLNSQNCGGPKRMEVDHFNPKSKKRRRQRYSCFVLSSNHCNGSKSNTWPSKKERDQGFYLVNPRKELLYERHVREDRESGRLVPITIAGAYNIEILDLNAPHLCELRTLRTKLRNLIESGKSYIVEVEELEEAMGAFATAWEESETIPFIPYFEGELDDDGFPKNGLVHL